MENRLVVLNRLIAQLERDVDFMDKYIKIVQEASHDLPPYQPQSQEEVIQQTTTFQDNDGRGQVMSMPASHLSEILDDSVTQATLKDFLARPVRIASGSWSESSTTGTNIFSINPWNLFFANSRIVNKLHNFGFIRCNLHVKVVINASPFYYGRSLVHYRPLTSFKTQVPEVTNNIELVPYSQRPSIWIRPEDNTGGELKLPFFWYKNWVNVQSAAEFTQLGQLRMTVYTPLQSANAVVGTGVSYQVYAWAEDVVLSGATLSLAMQSQDEYVSGPISGPATALSRIAASFTPTFGKFATATSLALKTTADIARMFGFTNVPVIEPTQPVRISQFANFASTETGYPLEKLTIDAKNELTVSPDVLGLPDEDQLVVKNLVTRSSYLTKTTWRTSDATNTNLFYANVHPRAMVTALIDGTTRAIHTTPMGHVAHGFRAWRGDIVYEFDVVASQYHKGKLQLAFDPQGDATNNVVAVGDTATGAYTVIMDLSKERTVSMRIPYQQAFGWLSTDNSNEVIDVFSTSTSPTFVYDPTRYNGAISVKVLNALTAPVDPSNVEILVRIRGGENLEFANPDGFRSTLSYFRPQSEDEVVEVAGSNEPSLDVKRGLMNYGEVVRSLRPLFRRTTYSTPVVFNVTGSSGYTEADFKHFKIPPYPGFDVNGLYTVKGVISPLSTFNYNWGAMGHMQWMLPCYVGYRGSTFWYYNVHGQTTNPNNLFVTRTPSNTTPVSISAVSSLGTSISARAMTQMKTGSSAGYSLSNPRISAGSGVAVPMQTPYLLHSTDPGNSTEGNTQTKDDAYRDCVTTSVADAAALVSTTGSTSALSLDTYTGAGTDFNVYFFLNVPTVYYNSAIPVPI
jgi:hypothetical protein